MDLRQIPDFFGSGVGVNPFQDWWRGVSENGTMGCYWPMPFEKSCSLKLANLGKQPVTVGTTVGSTPWKWDDHSMHLHFVRMRTHLQSVALVP